MCSYQPPCQFAASTPDPVVALQPQSLVLAPLFVWLELLFVCGYRPRLQEVLKARIEANVATSQGAAKKAQKEALLAPGEREGDAPATGAAANAQ